MDYTLVYIDEFHVSIRSSALYNWSPRDYPATFAINPDPWVISVIIALSSSKIEGIMVASKSINKKMFQLLVNDLCNQLDQEDSDTKNIFLIFDNARIHCCKDNQEFMVRSGMRWLRIPHYSPQLNAAEKAIDLIKVKLKKAWLEKKSS